MTIKLIGAVLVLLGCGGFGYMIAANARRESLALRNLISALDFMECELNYRMTPLPQLCRLTAAVSTGNIHKAFLCIAEELERNTAASVNESILKAMHKCPDIPLSVRQRFSSLGQSIGIFDLSGQLKCLKAVNAENARILEQITHNQSIRLRSYRTLSLCAGAALIVLFI